MPQLIAQASSLHVCGSLIFNLPHQTEDVIKIFNVKYPEGVVVFIFNCLSAHEAYAEDALLAHKMNRGPGGQQPKMHYTINPLTDEMQIMVFSADSAEVDSKGLSVAGKPKGMEQVLRKQGIL